MRTRVMAGGMMGGERLGRLSVGVMAIAIVTGLLGAGEAAGQSSRGGSRDRNKNTNPVASQPAPSATQPGMGTNPYIERYDPEEWVLDIRVDVASAQEILLTPQGNFPTQESWTFEQATIVFPVMPATAGFIPNEGDAFSGVLTFADTLKVSEFEILEGYPSGTKLAKWTLEGREGGYSGKRMNLDVKIQGTSYKVRFNEAEASKLPWPTGWPAEALEATKPEAFINRNVDGTEMDMSGVQKLVADWTKGKPQSQPPVVTAKWITKQVAEYVQTSGSGFGYSRTGKIQGIDPMGAAMTAERKRGSQFDMTCLLVACLREAGIPTRMVVGYDVASDKEERIFLKVKSSRSEDLRAWAEFALYDEARDILTWVPVDVVAQRKQSSRVPALDKPWEFFGNNEDLQGVVPFAFQFQPPTTVRAYGTPGFWGWLVLPIAPQQAEQWLTLHASSQSHRGGQPKRPTGRN